MATKKTASKSATKKQLPPLPEVASSYPSFYGSVEPTAYSSSHGFVMNALETFTRTTKDEAKSKGFSESSDTAMEWATGSFKAKDDRAAYALREVAGRLENVADSFYRNRPVWHEGNARQIVETALLMLTADQLAQLREKFLAVT